MTMPHEEQHTLKRTHEWLREMARSNITDINRREVREMAIALLRHYPFDFNIDRMYQLREKENDLCHSCKNAIKG